jgi:hypothetical protein
MKTILIAVAVVAAVVLVYFAVIDTNRGVETPMAQSGLDGAVPGAVPGAEVAEENVSNRLAGDAATDEAFESAQNLEEPVQSNIDSSRAIAGEAGAVGGTAFTVEGYERTTVVDAILDSELTEEEKASLVLELDAAEPQPLQLEEVLAVRLALGTQ